MSWTGPSAGQWTRPSVSRLHPMLGTYLAYHLPFYQELYQRRLVA